MTFTRLKLPRLQGSRSSAFSPARAVSVVAVVAHKVLVLVGDIDEQKVQPLRLRLDLVVTISGGLAVCYYPAAYLYLT